MLTTLPSQANATREIQPLLSLSEACKARVGYSYHKKNKFFENVFPKGQQKYFLKS